MLGCAANLDGALGFADGVLQLRAIGEVCSGEGVCLTEFVDRAFEHDLAALRAALRAQVDDVIRDHHHLRLVLHDQHRVALVAQLHEEFVHALDVGRMETGGGLVEDVGDVGER